LAAAAWSTGSAASSCRASAESAMRILLLTHSFNSLASGSSGLLRARGTGVGGAGHCRLRDRGGRGAVPARPGAGALPQAAHPASVWSRTVCWWCTPAPGDQAQRAGLDARMRGEAHWGVTVLQAVQDYDAGEVWAWEPFDVRPGPPSPACTGAKSPRPPWWRCSGRCSARARPVEPAPEGAVAAGRAGGCR
jgi:putative two-component system hydrogenase maturation factor HypX/HoxX